MDGGWLGWRFRQDLWLLRGRLLGQLLEGLLERLLGLFYGFDFLVRVDQVEELLLFLHFALAELVVFSQFFLNRQQVLIKRYLKRVLLYVWAILHILIGEFFIPQIRRQLIERRVHILH